MKFSWNKTKVLFSLAVMLVAGILLAGAGDCAYADTMKSGVVKCSSIDTVNTRTEPSTSAQIINKLANGKQVSIEEEVSGNDSHTWYYVSYTLDADGSTQSGYIRSDFVTVGDSSLQSLALSQGTLSPEFSPEVTSYTANVASDVTQLDVSAVPADANAQIVGISGNENLVAGENTIEIDVQASNGVTAAYYIVVTKADEAAQVTNGTATSGSSMSAGDMLELQSRYEQLQTDYSELEQKHKIMTLIMGVVIFILIVILLVMFFRGGHGEEEFDEDEFDEDEIEDEDFEEDSEDELDEKPIHHSRKRKQNKKHEATEETFDDFADEDDLEETEEPEDIHVEVIDIHKEPEAVPTQPQVAPVKEPEIPQEPELSLEDALLRNALTEDSDETKSNAEEEEISEKHKKKSLFGFFKGFSDVFDEEDLDDFDDTEESDEEDWAEDETDVKETRRKERATASQVEEEDDVDLADEFEDEFAIRRAKKAKKASDKKKVSDTKKASGKKKKASTTDEDDDLEFIDL